MAKIVTRFSELVRHRISTLRSETSAAVPHPTKVSLSQVKVTRAPTASAQQSKIVISEVPAGYAWKLHIHGS